jgi:LacI family transcriptional regulator
LPKPIAIMACNDVRARHVAAACRMLGLQIPLEVGVVGVDNDEMICLFQQPQLTSIDPDGIRVGQCAAELLQQLIAGKPAPQIPWLIPPRGIVLRRSTHVSGGTDPALAEAIAYIHAHAHRGIGVADLASAVPMSRRKLERLFMQSLGRTPAQEIRHARIKQAQHLLVDTQLSLDDIAALAGFGYLRQMRMVFARELGVSPQRYRKQMRG